MNLEWPIMSVSVVIPAYNAELYLEETVKSALSQSFRGDLEVIIVNDGSTDLTEAVAQALSIDDTRVIYVKQANGGPSKARNRGIDLAHGEWIAFLDADDQWKPEFLAQALVEAKKNAADGIIVPAERFIEIPGDDKERYGPSVEYSRNLPSSLLSGIPFAPCMVLARTEIVRAVGGFRGGDIFWEDWDFWIRFAESGGRLVSIEGMPLAFYRRSPNSRSSDALNCFEKSLATVKLHWNSPLARGPVKRRARAKFLRYLAKNSNGYGKKLAFFFKALLADPSGFRNWGILLAGLIGHPTAKSKPQR